MSNALAGLVGNWFPQWLNQPAAAMESIPDKKYRPHDAHDVYYMAFLLRQKVCPDLVPLILNLAEYWTKTSHRRSDRQSYTEHNAGEPYFTTKVTNTPKQNMVRKVDFTITSHDQGWSDYRQFHGTYEGSWTWFEAEVHVPDRGGPARNLECTRRRLCTNVHADRKDKTHVLEWSYDAEDRAVRNLVRALATGSVISVVPWAKYPGWRNYVSHVSIDIYVAAVTRL